MDASISVVGAEVATERSKWKKAAVVAASQELEIAIAIIPTGNQCTFSL
jgi:hypothetical protein